MNYEVKDSGQREDFQTGSRRDTRDGKGRFDLLPVYPLRRLAVHYEKGSAKYGDRNWELGQPLMRYLDSAIRHLMNLLEGEQTEDHASAAVFNIFGFEHTLHEIEEGVLPAELDDRPQRMRPYLTFSSRDLFKLIEQERRLNLGQYIDDDRDVIQGLA